MMTLYSLLALFGAVGIWALYMSVYELYQRFDWADFIILILSTAQILGVTWIGLLLYYGEI